MTAIASRFLPNWVTSDVLRAVRWAAVALWCVTFAEQINERGIPWLRSDLLVWLASGLVAASIGKRNVLTVVVDFVPFALVLIVYDYLRGLADSLGMPTWWHPQVDVDKLIFLGREPTVWLQEHLLYPDVRWWDVLTTLCYVSFFFLPYVTAAVLWLRSRSDFYRWSLRFVALSFIGFTFFALTPAAPPWAAAKCTAAQVAGHPYNPPCIAYAEGAYPGNLLGTVTGQHDGVSGWVQRTSGRGFGELNLHFAAAVIKAGQAGADQVAAVPSLHAGGIMLFTIFFWRRLNKWWRPFLVAYPIFMAFTLVYTAEHFFADVLAGWLAAWAVCVVADRLERRRKRRAPADTLKSPSGTTVVIQETSECPPTRPLPETTPSSTSANGAASSFHPARSTAAPGPRGTTGP